MSYRIKLLPEARLDLQESTDWYKQQDEKLGGKFYNSVKSRINYIKEHPYHFQIIYRKTRSALIKTFPFQVHYWIEEEPKRIIIFAITHTSRNPMLWMER